MKQETLTQIATWYAHVTDYLYLYSPEWELLWQNDSCPMLSSDKAPALFQQMKPPCTATIPYGGQLYSASLEQHMLSEDPQETCLLLRISKTPWEETWWQSELWRQETNNQAATIRNRVFGISNAVSALYEMLEGSENAADILLQEELEQLNIIKGNCCRLLQPTACLSELGAYHTAANISPELVSLKQEMSNLESTSRAVLGRRVQLQLSCPSQLLVSVHPERMMHAMLYVIALLCRKTPGIAWIQMTGKGQPGEPVQLTCTGVSGGDTRIPSRYDDPEPLFHTGLLSLEEQVLQKFCQTYGIVLLSSASELEHTYTLRFPPCSKSASATLHSFKLGVRNDKFPLVQLVLADISDYRFF